VRVRATEASIYTPLQRCKYNFNVVPAFQCIQRIAAERHLACLEASRAGTFSAVYLDGRDINIILRDESGIVHVSRLE